MEKDTKYFLYARKSTDAEDRQVRSIDAQLAELREMAAKDGLPVVEELIEKQTAKKPGRPIFNAMLDRIEAGEASGILAWHPDRLARNSVDGGRVIYLLDSKKLGKLRFHGSSVENTPQGKMMLNVEFGFSKYYVDALSENVKRGHRDKVQRGECPCIAPLGYLNDSRVKRIVVDRDRAPLVRRAFEMYASGTATLDTIRQYLADAGVRSRATSRSPGGRLLGRTMVSNMLSNPIYYGHFRWGQEVHEGRHEPIISKALFDQAQAVMNRRWRWSPQEHKRTPKAFLGLMRCAECGGAISAEVQKGHTYYRCTKKNKRGPRCRQPYIREEALDAEISRLLLPFGIPDGWGEEMLLRLARERESARGHAAERRTAKRREVERLTARLARLKELMLDGIIDPEEGRAERAEMLSRRKTLEEEADAFLRKPDAWLEPLEKWIRTAQTLGRIALTGSLTDKKALAKEVFGSNLVLEVRKARGMAVKPWSILADNPLSHDSAQLFDSARTFFAENPRRSLLREVELNQGKGHPRCGVRPGA